MAGIKTVKEGKHKGATKRTPVMCLETGERWEYLMDCAEAIGVSMGQLSFKIRFGEAIKGLHYVRAEI